MKKIILLLACLLLSTSAAMASAHLDCEDKESKLKANLIVYRSTRPDSKYNYRVMLELLKQDLSPGYSDNLGGNVSNVSLVFVDISTKATAISVSSSLVDPNSNIKQFDVTTYFENYKNLNCKRVGLSNSDD